MGFTSTYLAQATVQVHFEWSAHAWIVRLSPIVRASLSGDVGGQPRASYVSVTFSGLLFRKLSEAFSVGGGIEAGSVFLTEPRDAVGTYPAVGPSVVFGCLQLGDRRQHVFTLSLSYLAHFQPANVLVAATSPVLPWNPSVTYSLLF